MMMGIAANRRRYSPLSIAPSVWVKPKDLATMFQSGTRGAEGTAVSADGTAVGLIYDKSGNNKDFTASGTTRPLYRTGTAYTDWLEFDGSDDLLENLAANLTDYPFSVGFWFIPGTDSVMFGITDTGVAAPGSRAFAWINSTSQPSLAARGSAAPQDNAPIATAFTAGQPHYGVFRWINATNRRISVMWPDGVIRHAQSTVSIAFNSLDAMFIGGFRHSGTSNLDPLAGKVGELWGKNADIQPDGLQLNDATLLQLAYGGVAL